MKIFKKAYFTILGLFFALPVSARYGLDKAAGDAGLKKSSIPALVGSIIGWLLSLVGVIFLVLTVYGGFLWMTSYGNEQKVTKAKDLIISAVIGLIIVVAAYTITNFVIGAIVG